MSMTNDHNERPHAPYYPNDAVRVRWLTVAPVATPPTASAWFAAEAHDDARHLRDRLARAEAARELDQLRESTRLALDLDPDHAAALTRDDCLFLISAHRPAEPLDPSRWWDIASVDVRSWPVPSRWPGGVKWWVTVAVPAAFRAACLGAVRAPVWAWTAVMFAALFAAAFELGYR